jgi:hypothetical protein
MSDKQRVKFLTAIWGQRYIEEFARVTLPSFLAIGNLPFLAQATNLEIVILTSEKSVEIFQREPAFKALEEICRLKFIFIDDLITTGVYGVTLTLAYARGILDSGSEQTNTYFVFMNSDFVLADGSLRTLVAKFAEGHPCIMAPSLRACSETVLPILSDAVDRSANRLAVPPRDMVRLSFDALHPTVIGKTITQDFVKCGIHNQIYWQVDSATLLGRYHLIFMLAIKPERPLSPVNSYCDYGFVPELVPSGCFTVLDDSDDFFMLELQPTKQEKQYMNCGRPRIKEIARELSVWTTREHRRFAEVDVVFHAGDLPSNLETVRKQAAAFMSRLHRMMRKKPMDHAHHFYWVFGVEAWSMRRSAGMDTNVDMTLPPECGPLYPKCGLFSLRTLHNIYKKILGRLRHLAGVQPNVPIWHHGWLDSRLVLNWVADIKARPNRRNLLVSTAYSPLARSLGNTGAFDVIHARDLMDDEGLANWLKVQGSDARYGNVLCHVYRSDVRHIRGLLERLTVLSGHDTVVGVYVDHEEGDTVSGNFSAELAQDICDVLPGGWTGRQVNGKFAGGRVKQRLLRMERRLSRYLLLSTWKSVLGFPFAVFLLPFVAGLTAVNNWRLRHGCSSCPPYCSSALLCLSRRTAPTVADQSAP